MNAQFSITPELFDALDIIVPVKKDSYWLSPATAGSAAVDLRVASLAIEHDAQNTRVELTPSDLALKSIVHVVRGQNIVVGTGIHLDTGSPTVAGLILPRSGSGTKYFELRNTAGLIDSDYRGEIILKIHVKEATAIQAGDRIAQLALIQLAAPQYTWVGVGEDALNSTERGAGGFGHTGSA